MFELDNYGIVCSSFDKLFNKIKKIPSSEILKYIEDKLIGADSMTVLYWYENWASLFGISFEEVNKYCNMLNEKRDSEKSNFEINTNNNFDSFSSVESSIENSSGKGSR